MSGRDLVPAATLPPKRLSVIVPTSGRTPALARTLPTMLEQTFPAGDYELLVVENGAETGARRVARALARRHPRHTLRYFQEPTPGLLSGRHRGAIEARGEILVFADDDIDASPDWLESIVETFADPAVHLVGGRNLPRYESSPPGWIEGFWYTPPYGGRACIYLSLLDLGEEPLIVDANYVWGLNFSIRRETLFELGGFHPDNIPDHLQHYQGDGETGLTMKANERGRTAIYQPRVLVHHRIPAARLTVGYFCRRAYYQGVCDSFTAIRRDPAQGLAAAAAPEPSAAPERYAAGPQPEHGGRRKLGAFFRRIARRPLAPPAEAEPTYAEAEARVRAAYRAGYDFHQRAVRSSARLREWVLRPDYWDYRLPSLEVGDLSRRG